MTGRSVEERIQQRLNRMKYLAVHLVLTLIVTLGIVYSVENLNLPMRVEDDIIPIVVLAFIAHALWWAYREGRQFIIQQETQRVEDEDEKPKHDLTIGDDGELVEIMDADTGREKIKHAG